MKDSLEKINRKCDDVIKSLGSSDGDRLRDALAFAEAAHAGQIRKSGDPYLIHPLRTACFLWDCYQDVDLTVAALLHDTVEDSNDQDERVIYKKFGNKVGFLVEAMNKRKGDFWDRNKPIFKDKVERLLWAGMQDVRALLLKLADRADNLLTIGSLPENKQVRMTFETQAIFEPLRDILGLGAVEEKGKGEIDAIQKILDDFLLEKKISSPKVFKKYLYSQFFEGFTYSTYNLVYSGSDRIIWELDDREYYKELCHNEDFSRNQRMISVWTDGQNFRAEFSFQGGCFISKSPRARFKISSCRK